MTLKNIIDNYESISFSDLRKTQLATDKELCREIQTILKKIKIHKDEVDGEFGPISKTALQDFIETEGISQDYTLDSVVAELLLSRVRKGQDNLCGDFADGKEAFVEATIELCQKHGLPLNEQIAYVIATAEHETAGTFKVVKEAFWLSEEWRKRNFRYYPYYGRGYVQLTHEYNYKKYSNLLGIDFVAKPDKVLDKRISLFILVHGCSLGLFSGRRLGEYVNKNEKDYVSARKVINGRDRAKHIAKIAEKWLDILINREEAPAIKAKSIGGDVISDSIIEQYKRLQS